MTKMETPHRHDHRHDHCHDLLSELSACLDGEAEQQLCAEIERHMQDCANCRAVVNTLDRTVRIYRTLPAPEMPAGVEERLLRVLRIA
jgi:anti-sigma factor RsiW